MSERAIDHATALVVTVLLMIGLPFASVRADSAISSQPPSQPTTGPGGREAQFTKVIVAVHDDEEPGYWLFEPKAPRDRSDGRSPPAA